MCKDLLERFRIDPIHSLDHRRRIIVLQVGHQQAHRRSSARALGNERHRDLGQRCQAIGMGRTSTAKSHQREISRIVTALYRNQSQRVDHRRIGDLDDPMRRLYHLHTQRSSAALRYRPPRGVGVQADFAA